MKTLYITDLDGTLLHDNAQVSEFTARTLTALSRRGALISVATARTPATVSHIMAEVHTTVPMVVMTGAAMWSPVSHTFSDLQLIERDRVDALHRVFDASAVTPFCYTLAPDSTHLEVFHSAAELSPAEQYFVDLRKKLSLKHFDLHSDTPDSALNRVALFFAIGSEADIVAAAEAAKAATDCYVSYYKDIYFPDTWLLEIFAHGVSKAHGVERLRQLTGADRVVVFGDNLNDIAMMQCADVAVAVDNALPQTKAVANIIIGSNNSDAVARYILEDFDKNQ
ncbi:MAG: HAD-IIB family hydrolase [Muribaculaceae bacterium]